MSSKANTESVKVIVRVRPMNKNEYGRGCKPIVKVDRENNQIEIRKPEDTDGKDAKVFSYDAVYAPDS
jgi:hypothetical protein